MIYTKKKYKGYFKRHPRQLFVGIMMFFVFAILFIMVHFNKSRDYDHYFFLAECVGALYFYLLERNINKKDDIAWISSFSLKRAKGMKRAIDFTLVFSLANFIMSLFLKMEPFLVYYQLPYIIMWAFVAFNLIPYISFYDTYYISTEYKIYYQEVDRIEVTKKVNSLSGYVVSIDLFKNGKKIGQDKMHMDDFDYLNSVIEQQKLQL